MTNTRLIDISPVVSERIAVWPGDVAFSRTVSASFAAGDHLDLSSIHTTVHVGAHTDAPSHYHALGTGISERSLDRYYGPCQVISVSIERGARILPEHIVTPIEAPRVLFRTGTFPDPDAFNRDFAALSPELVHYLGDRGVQLVGIDTPSIDPCDSKKLEAHNAVADRDMAILEGIVLGHVAPGNYLLIALPLKIEGADASPVRAALVP